jgi:hypothetical protein
MYTKFTNVSKSKTDHDRCWQGPSTDLGGPCFPYLKMGPKSGPFFGLETGVVLATPQHWVSFFWARFYDQKTGLVLGPRFPAGVDGVEGQLSSTESSATHREQLYDNTTNGTLQLLRVAYTSTSDTDMKTVCCFYNDQPNSAFARQVSLQLRTSAPLPTPIRKLCSIQIRAPAFVFTKAMPTKFHVLLYNRTTPREQGVSATADFPTTTAQRYLVVYRKQHMLTEPTPRTATPTTAPPHTPALN